MYVGPVVNNPLCHEAEAPSSSADAQKTSMPPTVGAPIPIRPRRPQSLAIPKPSDPASPTNSSAGSAPFRMPPSPPPSDGDNDVGPDEELGSSSASPPTYSPPIPKSILTNPGGGQGVPARMGSPPPGNMATRSVPRATRSKLASSSGVGPSRSSSVRSSSPPRSSIRAERTERAERYNPVRTDSEAHATAQAYAHHLEQEHAFGGTHWLPLVFAVVPGIGAIFHGEAESWTDGLVVLLGGIFLWQMAKIPWQTYTQARITRLLAEAKQSHRRGDLGQRDASEVHRYELVSLFLTVASPVLGLLLLQFCYSSLSSSSQPSLINRTSLVLYGLGAAVRPLTHLTDLVLARIAHLQSLAQPPPAPAIAHLRNEVARVKEDLSSLKSVGATQADVRHLRDTLDLPLGQLSRAIRRTVRAEEGMRMDAEERFAMLEVAVEELSRRIERDERVMRRLEGENDALRTTPIAAVTALFGHLLGLGTSRASATSAGGSSNGGGKAQPKDGVSLTRTGGGPGWTDRAPFVLFFFPINVAALAFAYVGSVMIGSPSPPLKRVEAGSSPSSSLLSPTSSTGSFGDEQQYQVSAPARGRKSSIASPGGAAGKGKGKAVVNKSARFVSPDRVGSLSSGSGGDGEADELLLD